MHRFLLVLTLTTAACGASPTAPAPTPPPAPIPQPVAVCVAQNTATVTVVNASPNNFTFDVLMDNITQGTIAPGQFKALTVTAGADHVLLSRVTNTGATACVSTTSFIQCSSQTLTCRF